MIKEDFGGHLQFDIVGITTSSWLYNLENIDGVKANNKEELTKLCQCATLAIFPTRYGKGCAAQIIDATSYARAVICAQSQHSTCKVTVQFHPMLLEF